MSGETDEFVVFYDVLVDGDLRRTDAYCVDERDLHRQLLRINNHGYENVEVFKKIPTPPTKDCVEGGSK